jgi:molybdate transport system substrate-binding protein
MADAIRRFTTALKLLPILALVLAGPAFAQGTPEKVANAKPGDMRLFISNGLREPFKTVRAQAEKMIGKPLVVDYGASRGMQSQIEAGQAFDIAILTPDVIADMISKGKIVPGSSTDLARVPVAIAVRGVDKIDVSTPEAVKAVLLGARSVGFSPIGASLPTVSKMFAAFGIADAMKAKFHLLPPINDTSAMPPAGQYDLILNLISEILPLTGGWNYVGDTPDALSVPVIMSAGIGSQGDAATAKKLITFLQGPAIEPGLKANHMSR